MTNTNSDIKTGELSAEIVADYLRRHPHFLNDRPELLSELCIPHQTARGVSSLIERQVANLRQENQHQRHQIESLTDSQNEIRTLTEQGHDLALNLLKSEQILDVCELWHDFVTRHYTADAAALFLFLEHTPLPETALLRIRGRYDKLRLMLVELFNRNRPLIDSLQAELIPLMFDRDVDDIHSTILLPMSGRGWDGLLAIGSQQHDRYCRDQAFELLVFLVHITAMRLEQWLQSDPALSIDAD